MLIINKLINIFWFYQSSCFLNQEKIRTAQVEEREKRAAVAKGRIATLKIQDNSAAAAPSISEPKRILAGDIYCSCCNTSFAGKVPCHLYNYKYCSTSSVHVHREILEDGWQCV